jgi:hypothetical protein
MAWTTPPTFTTAVLASSTMNSALRDNTNYLLNGKNLQTKMYYKGADYNYVAVNATWTAVDTINLRLTSASTQSSGRFRVYARFYATATATGTGTCEMDFDVIIDSTYFLSVALVNGGVATTGNPANNQALFRLAAANSFANVPNLSIVTLDGYITGLSTGATHTFDLTKLLPTFNNGTGAATATIYGTNNPIVMLVEEI